ncbi:MAG TPA: hypothetical protein VG366_02095, partial [Solirubrobacteraceae bacterium]|nr:hypothetical protein [Solirubrobacteraceae bacterium]
VPYDVATSWSMGGLEVSGFGGVRLFRSLYEAGRVRLAGRDASGNWKLESKPTASVDGTRAKLVATVDPHRFLPHTQELIDTEPGRHAAVLARARMLDYQQIVASAAKTWFDAQAQHPHARIVTRSGSFPAFQALHARHAVH